MSVRLCNFDFFQRENLVIDGPQIIRGKSDLKRILETDRNIRNRLKNPSTGKIQPQSTKN